MLQINDLGDIMLAVLMSSEKNNNQDLVNTSTCGKKMPGSVNYVLEPGQPVSPTRLHCKRCHYTGKVRADYAPKQCPNEKGWIDETGVKHPKCNNRRLWHRWPSDFDPDTCQCLECLIIWHLEKEALEKKKQAQAAQSPLSESVTVELPARRRGRPPKYKKS
jgi:ssDNA-binding Zn-finger/Zn-ribbon topoisomerase 1